MAGGCVRAELAFARQYCERISNDERVFLSTAPHAADEALPDMGEGWRVVEEVSEPSKSPHPLAGYVRRPGPHEVPAGLQDPRGHPRHACTCIAIRLRVHAVTNVAWGEAKGATSRRPRM